MSRIAFFSLTKKQTIYDTICIKSMRRHQTENVEKGGERPDGGAAYQGFQDAGADVRRRGTTGAKSVTKGGERPAGYAASHLQRDIIRGRIYPDHVMATANHFIVGPSPQKKRPTRNQTASYFAHCVASR